MSEAAQHEVGHPPNGGAAQKAPIDGTSSTAAFRVPAPAPVSSLISPPRYKLVFLGDVAVGKTSIITRFMYDTFDKQYQATIGIDFLTKTMVMEDRVLRLQLWDTAGQERFRSLIPNYIRDSAGAVVVYDIASRSTFMSAFSWIQDIRAERGSDFLVVLVGNKTDLSEKREVSSEEGQQKAQEHKAVFLEVSAKAGTNVKGLFRKIANLLPAQPVVPQSTSASLKELQKKDPFLVTPSRAAEVAGGSSGSSGKRAMCFGGC